MRGKVCLRISANVLFEEWAVQIDEAYAELNIVQDFIPVGNSNRPGRTLAPKSITIHNTDNTDVGANAAAHAKYQKGADARRRRVSWHFTVDDKNTFQSLPTNEVGWHTSSTQGNRTSIGVEICMNAGMDEKVAYERAALLTAVLAFQHGIRVRKKILQHHDWSGKNCPRVLRAKENGWENFLKRVKELRKSLKKVPAPAISLRKVDDHHLFT
jgi:N-acetylmuramoyl-L-alanine amidase CwlA